MRSSDEAGAIRLRTLFEFLFIFVLAYVGIQVAPIVVLRMNFLNELEVAANSPVEESADAIRRKVIATAEGYGITLLSEKLHVNRDRERRKTIIDATYQLHIFFWPAYTYVWTVHDRVEGLWL